MVRLLICQQPSAKPTDFTTAKGRRPETTICQNSQALACSGPFYPAHTCPFCQAQLGELARQALHKKPRTSPRQAVSMSHSHHVENDLKVDFIGAWDGLVRYFLEPITKRQTTIGTLTHIGQQAPPCPRQRVVLAIQGVGRTERLDPAIIDEKEAGSSNTTVSIQFVVDRFFPPRTRSSCLFEST